MIDMAMKETANNGIVKIGNHKRWYRIEILGM